MDPEKKLPEDPDRFERKSVKEAIRGPLIKCSAWYPQSDLSLLLGSQTQHLATGGEREMELPLKHQWHFNECRRERAGWGDKSSAR